MRDIRESMGKALENQGCKMATLMICWHMVVTQVYWMTCRDFLLLTMTNVKETPDMKTVKHTLRNLQGYMKYVRIEHVKAMQPINILQLSLKEQILERLEEVNELMTQIDNDAPDAHKNELVFLQAYLGELL
jgi:hypothetical protein